MKKGKLVCYTPGQIDFFLGVPIRQVACGEDFSIVLTVEESSKLVREVSGKPGLSLDESAAMNKQRIRRRIEHM